MFSEDATSKLIPVSRPLWYPSYFGFLAILNVLSVNKTFFFQANLEKSHNPFYVESNLCQIRFYKFIKNLLFFFNFCTRPLVLVSGPQLPSFKSHHGTQQLPRLLPREISICSNVRQQILPRRSCLNDIHGNCWTNYCEKGKNVWTLSE